MLYASRDPKDNDRRSAADVVDEDLCGMCGEVGAGVIGGEVIFPPGEETTTSDVVPGALLKVLAWAYQIDSP